MASILVRHNKKFRLWNTTVDAWECDLMNKNDMFYYLVNVCGHTKNEAVERLERKGYKKDHLEWLKKFYDKKYYALNKEHKSKEGK